MNLATVSRDDKIVLGVVVVLLIDLIAFPWFSPGFGVTLTATDAPDSFFGILGVLGVIALLADVAVPLFAPETQLPVIGGSRQTTRTALVALVAVALALKFLLQISHFSDLGWGFWLAAILLGVLVWGALQARRGLR